MQTKHIVRGAAITLISAAAVLLSGCSNGKKLSEKELAKELTSCIGETVEIVGEPERDGPQEIYSVRCADGMEFTVTCMQMNYDYFGSDRYFEYKSDYLVKWVNAHPEVNALFAQRGITCEEHGRGSQAVARDFDEVRSVVETACEVVESGQYLIPAVTENDGEKFKVLFDRPVIMIECLSGKTGEYDRTSWLWEEFEYPDGTASEDYDEEMQVFLAEQRYVDDCRDGSITLPLPYAVMMQYPPEELTVQLLSTEYPDSTLRRKKISDEDFRAGERGPIFLFGDGFKNQGSEEKLEFPVLAGLTAYTGFTPAGSTKDSFTFARGTESVVFHFSETDSYAERNGARVDIRGEMVKTSSACWLELTTDDLSKLFDTHFDFDYVNCTAYIR